MENENVATETEAVDEGLALGTKAELLAFLQDLAGRMSNIEEQINSIKPVEKEEVVEETAEEVADGATDDELEKMLTEG